MASEANQQQQPLIRHASTVLIGSECFHRFLVPVHAHQMLTAPAPSQARAEH